MTPLTRSEPNSTLFLRNFGLALGGAALITLGAKVQIPFWPVPMTLHTLSVFLVAAALGPRLAVAAMATYLAAGAMGFPVFSGSPERGIGLAYIAGPTGGYLLGYLLAAGLIGWFAKRTGWLGQALSMLAGLAIVYAAGLVWLATFLPSAELLAAGFTPFIIGDLIKVALACGLFAGLRSLKGKAQ